MSSIKLLVALIAFATPSIVSAQYDFDDFIKAVESGQSKSAPPQLEMPRLAQLPQGSGEAAMSGATVLQAIPTDATVQLEPMPYSVVESSMPTQVNFEQLFQMQDVGLSDRSHHGSCCPSKSNCQTCRRPDACRQCSLLPYQVPELPAPSTLRGYFNASPCIANVWDGYACEASERCAKTQQIIAGTHGR